MNNLTRPFPVGSKVRLVGLPEGLRDDTDLPTLTVSRKCQGQVFTVSGFNQYGMAELCVESVTGRVGETIWVEPNFLVLVSN
jgi:hypothetical protein